MFSPSLWRGQVVFAVGVLRNLHFDFLCGTWCHPRISFSWSVWLVEGRLCKLHIVSVTDTMLVVHQLLSGGLLMFDQQHGFERSVLL